MDASTGTPAVDARLPADFWRLGSASVVSRLGGGIASSATPLLAAAATRDPRAISLVSIAAGLPWLLFALHTGALADRWDRQRTMWRCDLVSALLYTGLAVVVLADRSALWSLCLVAFAAATVSTLFDSAGQAALPAVVPAGLLGRANSRLFTGTVLAGLFVGPPLGSWLFERTPAAPFALDALSFVGSAVLISRLRTSIRPAAPSSPTRLTGEIAEGLRWLRGHRQLRALVVLLTVWNLAEAGWTAVLVLYALEVLHVGASAYGLLLSGLAVGGLLGAGAAPRLSRRWGDGRVIAASVLVYVLAAAALAFVRTTPLAVALIGVVGLTDFAFNVVSSTYRQQVVPDRLRGRVSSAYRFATWGITPVGAALGGLLAAGSGTPAVLLAAAGALAAAAACTLPLLTDRQLAAGLPS